VQSGARKLSLVRYLVERFKLGTGKALNSRIDYDYGTAYRM
jgi:hypothetical protein